MTQRQQTTLAVLIYLGGITSANLYASAYGAQAVPIITFTLIGLDLSLRDFLQLSMKRASMLGIILLAGILSYLASYFFNGDPDKALNIAVASGTAFTVASIADWTVFAMMRSKWVVRANVSNIAGAMFDSVLFITIAFGFSLQEISVSFLSKLAGGFFWSFVLAYIFKKRIAQIDARNAAGLESSGQ
jgi:uncharacterized PurR-regulated membrane protein YhhQ (DUF165 family)